MALTTLATTNHATQQQTSSCTRRQSRRKRMISSSSPSSSLRATTLILSSCLLLLLTIFRTTFLPSSTSSLRMTLPFTTSLFQIYYTAEAKEIVATHEWQLLGENDTIPAGLHVKMDLSTGEKWVKLASDEERDEDIKAAVHGEGEHSISGEEESVVADGNNKVQSVEMDASGALTIVESSDNNDDGNNENSNNNEGKEDDGASSQQQKQQPKKDYEMMHRVMSQLPPDELDKFGGLPDLPALPSSNNDTITSNSKHHQQLTETQRKIFEERMEHIWNIRQMELMKAQESLADLPSIIKDRIAVLKGYLEDVDGSLKTMLHEKRQRQQKEKDEISESENNEGGDSSNGEEEGEDGAINNVIDALRDLEFQLSDVDMARDFHTLGGWPYLVTLLDNSVHHVHHGDAADTNINDEEEEVSILVDEIQALAAMTIGTAVGNLGEFRGWALEDVVVSITTTNDESSSTVVSSSAMSLLIKSFEQELSLRSQQMGEKSTMAIPTTTSSNAKYKSRGTYKLRAVYALGSLLRGNPHAQQYFVTQNGADVLVRDVLGTLSNVRGPTVTNDRSLTKLDYKFASKVLALGQDVVMDVVLHEDEYIQLKIDDAVATAASAASKESKDDDNNNKEEEEKVVVLTSNQLVAAFTTEAWCDLSLRMLSPPIDIIGAMAGNGIKEKALHAVRALAPGCIEMSKRENNNNNEEEEDDGVSSSWGIDEVKLVRSEWSREGSDDGLDSVYRRDLLELVDGVIEVLQQ